MLTIVLEMPLAFVVGLILLQSLEAMQQEAARLYQLGKLDEAAAILESVLEQAPSHGPATFQLGTVYLRLDRKSEAGSLFGKLLKDYPESADVAHRIGVVYFLAGELKASRSALLRAVGLDPRHVEALLTLGQLEGRDRHHDRALELLNQVTALAPELEAPYYYGAAILELEGDSAGAIAALEKGASLAPKDARFTRMLGASYLKLEQWSDAEKALTAALDNGAGSTDVYLDLGRAYLGQERLVPAGQAFAKARELAPDSAEPLLQLGYIAWMLRDYDRAIELLEACLDRDPELMRAHHFLGLIALRKRDFDRAEEQFVTALDSDPGFAEAHFNLGKIYLRRGEPERAVARLERAINYRSDYKEAYYQLSFAYRRLGREELASEALARFEELDEASR